jgi:hypothetical protein
MSLGFASQSSPAKAPGLNPTVALQITEIFIDREITDSYGADELAEMVLIGP